MVWVHGGAFIHGTANELFYNNPRLSGNGVVLVTVQYARWAVRPSCATRRSLFHARYTPSAVLLQTTD